MEHIFQPLFFLLMIPKIFFSDLILIYSPPLMLGYVGSLVGKVLRIPTIVNIQDIHPQAVADLGLIRNPLMLFMLECIERQIYHNSTSIVVHSDGNKKLVIKHGANPNKVLIIHNISEIPSDEVLSSGNQFRKGKKIDNTLFVVTYAGIMSYSQDLKTIILAAKILANTKKILFCLAGNGPLRKPLESLTGKLGLNNVRFLPFQSGDDYWKLLSASDVCMVSLKKSTVKTPVVPRKLGDIMAAGKPVIANVPYEGDVKNFINKAKCGVMVESENPELLANVIFNFSNLKIEKILQYGHKGRLYALENFSSEKVSQQYECLFNSLKKQM
ncbi:MAG: glycosyltransferase family 4 protein [Clostridiales bacterium]|nr:glycosyltransferase family 4 protein [Clostridiales bacterium]